jgi:DnaJ-class molecular chaperone
MDALTERTCPHCQGTGSYTNPGDCPRCDGAGVVANLPRLADPPPQCDCPKEGGVIRHRRATCTDPAVAKLNWYAAETP